MNRAEYEELGLEHLAFRLIGDGPSLVPRTPEEHIPRRDEWEELKAGVDAFYENTSDAYISAMNRASRRSPRDG